MRPYYERADHMHALLHWAKEWLGTPFGDHQAVRGVAVDCVHLCAQLYVASGFMGHYRFPPYAMDEGSHSQESKIDRWVREHGGFHVVTPPQIGDMVTFRIGNVGHHAGVMVSDVELIHARRRYGTRYSRLDDPTYRRALSTIYRPMTDE